MSFAKDPEIAAEWKKVTVKKAMNPCPIDFSEFHSSNPRAHTVQKEYDGQDHSNFNRRQKYADDEEPQFTTPFGEGPGFLPVEAGRYRLIWSRHCPWAHRIAIAIDLLGLDQVISKGVFALDPDGVDPVLKVHSLGECYRKGNPHYDQRSTVPAIVDVTTGAVVNNDYHDLTTELETAWKKYFRPDAPDLYPEALHDDIDALNDIIYADVNLAVNQPGSPCYQPEGL